MCQTGPTIKFSACDPAQIDPDASWRLQRRLGPSLEIIMGGLLNPEEQPVDQKLILAKILTDLNGSKCFDFIYQPEHGDRLVINLRKITYRLEYRAWDDGSGEWHQDEFAWPGSPEYQTTHEGVVQVAAAITTDRRSE